MGRKKKNESIQIQDPRLLKQPCKAVSEKKEGGRSSSTPVMPLAYSMISFICGENFMKEYDQKLLEAAAAKWDSMSQEEKCPHVQKALETTASYERLAKSLRKARSMTVFTYKKDFVKEYN
ncbi:HMG1/2-like protein [Rhodamnia argentea]|uniref:HMG1/2-like protein n=1 Tax=Rhodamnia argentea TaxID=178133 RepID=A0ABM3GTX3_9MYRT|nr:HMG1/2-like protein [Rhodamnia argentea]